MTISEYFDVKRADDGREVMEVYLDGIVLLRLAMTNKGTAFSHEERERLRLEGLLPPEVSTLPQQVDRAYGRFSAMADDLAKYQFLRGLQDRQEVLFYALLGRHLEEMLPIVYTPTVGDAVRNFHLLYQHPRGLSLCPRNIESARAVTEFFPWNDVRMIVATDAAAILGIGDQGYGGLAISIGKLALYTAAGGVSPMHAMPVSLDVGTDRADLRDDPLYLGVRRPRMRGEEYIAFVDRFVDAVRARWPRAILQWEDLSKDTAFAVLERYRDVTPSFNDDIQGTGAVTLAGLLAACRLNGERLSGQTVVVHGAGAGGVGVAWAVREGMVREGLTREEASARIFVLDSRGLLTTDRAMEDYKRPFAQDRARLEGWGGVDLLSTVRHARATVLLGLSGQPGAFDEAVVRAAAANAERPIVFALSNPTSSCEALPKDVFAWTDGRARVATGSPFPDVDHGGRSHPVGQGNNAFIFPGLGQGALVAGARKITDGMVLEAAYALADLIEADGGERIYPPVSALRDAARAVARRVAEAAIRDGVATMTDEAEVDAAVDAAFWSPEYLPVVRGERR
ncbi:MAG: NAD-dependent malic enzyme [Polyangiaceae bacterium]|nr:NAD-dependent malic enzyme [Polyangiaceae bacterium]